MEEMAYHQKSAVSLFASDGTRKYLTTSEVRRFLFHGSKQEERIALLCMVLAYTGCRLSEALNLTAASIDFESRAITFQTLKQRRRGVFRQVPIPANLLRKFRGLISINPHMRIWPIHRQTGRRWISAVMRDANLVGVKATSRGLRHGFAVGALEQDIPITLLQKWMGHARLETTAIYTTLMGAEERLFAKRRWNELEAVTVSS